jgi:hypothetical protein
MTLLCKKIIVSKSKEVKPGCNQAESSNEDCGPKMAVLPIIMIMMMILFFYFSFQYSSNISDRATSNNMIN